MFENLTTRLQDIFKDLRRRGKLNEADVDTVLREVRLALLEADVHYQVAKTFVARVRERAVGEEVTRSLTPAQQVVKIVHDELITTLGEPGDLYLTGSQPAVVMLVGLQGSGKTTTAAKLALHLRSSGARPYLVAADTQRPAAIEQLQTLGGQLEVLVYAEEPGAPPPDICARGVDAARQDGASVVILDTAGRLQIDETLMDELVSIKAKTGPAEVLLVADAMTGQEAVRIAEGFHERIGLSGLILTKTDGDARGGAAISMREVTGVPIKLLGAGEKLDALEVFYPDRLASRILGMGDVLTLIEQAEAKVDIDEDDAMALMQKMQTGQLTLEDFQKLLRQMKKLGPLGQVLKMMPGMGQLDTRESEEADKQLVRIEAIINSMTPGERRRPKIINASRKRRIASGSGTSVQEINRLLKQFRDMQRVVKQLSRGKLPSGMNRRVMR
jgi:signal recognition particle subunit SRP54